MTEPSDFNAPTEAQIVSALHAHIERRDDVIYQLRLALQPFAALAAGIDPAWADERRLATINVKIGDIKLGDIRRAAAADLGIAVSSSGDKKP